MATDSSRQSRLSGFAGWFRQPAAIVVSTGEAVAGRYQVTTIFAVVTCAVLPAYVVRWHVGPLPTTLLEIAILLTFAIFALESYRARSWPVWRSSLTIPAILFLIVGVISVVVSPEKRAALGLYRAYLVEPIGFGLVVINVALTIRRAVAIVGGLWVGAAVAGLVNAIIVLVAFARGGYDVLTTPPVLIYNTANAVALFLVPLIAVASAFVLYGPSRRDRVLAALFLLIAIPSTILSFSRGGYLALAAVTVGIAISHRQRLLLLIGGAVSAAVLLQTPQIKRRVGNEIDLHAANNTLVGRFHLWSATLKMLHEHPIFGAGLSGFGTDVGPYWNPSHAVGDRYAYPHNILLNFWTETGILGVLTFGWILVAGFVHSWRGWQRGPAEWKAIHLGVLLALVAVIAHGLVDVPYFKNDLAIEFWALLGLSFALGASQLRERSASSR